MPADLAVLEAHKRKLALFGGFDVKLDGVPNKPHITGCLGLWTGVPIAGEGVGSPTLNTIIGDKISART